MMNPETEYGILESATDGEIIFTRLMPVVQTEFLSEKDISDDKLLREDYEKLRITSELLREIGTEVEIDAVLKRILNKTLEFLAYDRGSILIVNRKGGLQLRARLTNGNGNAYRISKTLVRHVIQKKAGVISSDIMTDERFKESESIRCSGVRSSMAVPIICQSDILGVMVLESSLRIGVFTEKDLGLIMNIANHTAQMIKNSLLHEELQQLFISAIRTLSATVDARHPLTAGHSERVSTYAVMIGRQMGLNRKRLKTLNYAALLHDIGKIGISDMVLRKNGPLDEADRKEMNTHPLKSREILEKFHFPASLKNVPLFACFHHERVDGQGYPFGIGGDDLPLEARIISVADVFDALTSPRDYPKYDGETGTEEINRMSIKDALDILEKNKNVQFDARVVSAFRKCLPKALRKFQNKHFPREFVASFLSETVFSGDRDARGAQPPVLGGIADNDRNLGKERPYDHPASVAASPL